MARKAFYIIILVLVLAVILFGLFFLISPGPGPGEEKRTFREFLPFGPRTPESPRGEDLNLIIPEPEPAEEATKPVLPKFRRVSTFPVAGAATIIQKEADRAPVARYIEKATGHLHETYLDFNDEVKITNTTIPGVQETLWGENRILLRYLKDDSIETFSAEIKKEENGTSTLEGVFLDPDILHPILSPDGKQFFYLIETKDGVAGQTASLDGGKRIQIFSSPFTEWLPAWPAANLVTLNTKPSADVAGFLYKLDLKTKSLEKIMGDISGLLTLANPKGELILYSETAGREFRTGLYNPKSRVKTPLGLKTLPEKCVWSKISPAQTIYCAVPREIQTGNYPDMWYQGLISFSDNIWAIDLETNNFKLLADPVAENGEMVDAINLVLDQREKYLLFVNKKDNFLWGLELETED